MVVAGRSFGLCSASVAGHLLPHDWTALQGIQREEPEATRTLGD